jgi:VanZ family protein
MRRTASGTSGVADNQERSAPRLSVRSNRGHSKARLVLVAILIAYWLLMFFGTHIPRVPTSLAGPNDKVLHLLGYGGLAVLLLGWRSSRGPVTIRTITLLWLLLGCYGAFDEITQPLVGRHADIADWIADVVGAAIGLGITWPLTARFFGHMPDRRSTVHNAEA